MEEEAEGEGEGAEDEKHGCENLRCTRWVAADSLSCRRVGGAEPAGKGRTAANEYFVVD